jgi:hypothetical protein
MQRVWALNPRRPAYASAASSSSWPRGFSAFAMPRNISITCDALSCFEGGSIVRVENVVAPTSRTAAKGRTERHFINKRTPRQNFEIPGPLVSQLAFARPGHCQAVVLPGSPCKQLPRCLDPSQGHGSLTDTRDRSFPGVAGGVGDESTDRVLSRRTAWPR